MRPAGPEEEVICPDCKRYVGTFERCPYCGARVPTRLSFRLIKWGGLAVAICGILFLYVDLHTTRLVVQDSPTVEISEITPVMNFAQVYIQGKATFVKYYDDTRFLGMSVADENGNNLFVRAYDAETLKLIGMEKRRLAENDPKPKFPAVGDIVTVRGQLRIRPDFYMMILQYGEGLTIKRPKANRVTIEYMVKNKENFGEFERLEIGGKVLSIYDLTSKGRKWATGLTIYELSSEAETSVIISTILEKFGRTLEAKIGDMIRVKGAFQLHYGTPQLWLASWDDLEVIG